MIVKVSAIRPTFSQNPPPSLSPRPPRFKVKMINIDKQSWLKIQSNFWGKFSKAEGEF